MIAYDQLNRSMASSDHAPIACVEIVHVSTRNGVTVERPLADLDPFDRFGVVVVLVDGVRVLCKTSHGFPCAYDMAARARRVVNDNAAARLSWVVNAINASTGHAVRGE